MVSKIHLLLLSTLGVLLCSLPAEAARILGWRFDEAQNRLEFTTDDGVQPRAQLAFNPTRVVVDLPGTRLDKPLVQESLAGTIRSYRIGQFDAETTRIVIEVAKGYELDPSQVKVRGLTPKQWVVELPEPQPKTTGAADGPSSAQQPVQPAAQQTVAQATPQADAPTQVNEVRSTPDGLFVRIAGEPPRVKIKRSRDRRTIDVQIRDAALGSAQIPLPSDSGKLGIRSISTEQKQGRTPEAIIRLEVAPDAPNWKATVSSFGGIVLLPTSRPEPIAGSGGSSGSGSSAQRPPSSTQAPSPGNATANQIATLQGVSIDRRSNQLILQLDRPARYSTRQDGSDYILTLSPARLGSSAKEPPIFVGDRLRRVQLTQRGPQSVEIRLTPDRSVTIGEVQVPNLRMLSLPLQRSRQPGGRTGQINVIPPAGRPAQAPRPPVFSPNIDLPPSNGRPVVVIDPGHGGPDPGAVGNGLKETEIVLDISRQVTAFLEAQGVQVVMTRNGEYDLDLQPRVDIAERVNATAFISIHANAISMARPDVNGVETYYYSSGKELARSIHESVLQSVDIGDRQLRSARFYVLRRTSMPAALVETGFITGAEDKYKLADPAFRTQMAKAIARGILRYLQ